MNTSVSMEEGKFGSTRRGWFKTRGTPKDKSRLFFSGLRWFFGFTTGFDQRPLPCQGLYVSYIQQLTGRGDCQRAANDLEDDYLAGDFAGDANSGALPLRKSTIGAKRGILSSSF